SRRRLAAVAHFFSLYRQRLGVQVAALGLVQQLGVGSNALDQLGPPFFAGGGDVLVDQRQARLATFFYHHAEVIVAVHAVTVVREHIALLGGTEQQEGVHETAGAGRDAGERFGVDIQAPDIDVLHAAIGQGGGGTL